LRYVAAIASPGVFFPGGTPSQGRSIKWNPKVSKKIKFFVDKLFTVTNKTAQNNVQALNLNAQRSSQFVDINPNPNLGTISIFVVVHNLTLRCKPTLKRNLKTQILGD